MENRIRKVNKEIVSANIIGVLVEHNGIQGGDAGHGGYVKINIKDLASTSMEVNGEDGANLELIMRGDTERETLIDALKFIVNELETHKIVK